jgi:hypothetical protein
MEKRMRKLTWVLRSYVVLGCLAIAAGCGKSGDTSGDVGLGGEDGGAVDAGSHNDGGRTDGGAKTDAGAKSDGGLTDAGGEIDGAVPTDAGSGSDAGGSPDASAQSDAGGQSEDGGGLAQPFIDRLDPETGEKGASATLQIIGQGFASGAAVYFGGDGALSDVHFVDATTIEATVPKASTAKPGYYPVVVQNQPSDGTTRSNVVYFRVGAADGGPAIIDFSPDNGVEGDAVRAIGTKLSGEELTLSDPNGTMATSTAFDTITLWLDFDTAEFTLPVGWVSGPITVSNSKGAFVGKPFHVGQNLAHAPGTVATASSENSSWPVGRGDDNLLETSWFADGDACASQDWCTIVPWYLITLPQEHPVGRIGMRGNREWASGYGFIKGLFEILNGSDDEVVWKGVYSLPALDRDLDIAIPPGVKGRKVRFTSVEDETYGPGFSELEVFEP